MMSSLGQEIPVTTVRRQSTGTQESYPSLPPFSAHLLEIVVWISETWRKSFWLSPHILQLPGTKKVKWIQEKNHQYNLSFLKNTGQDSPLQWLLRTAEAWYSSVQQDPATISVWYEMGMVVLLHGDGRLWRIIPTAHVLFHKQLYAICSSSRLMIPVISYLPGQVLFCCLHIRSHLHYNTHIYFMVFSQ